MSGLDPNKASLGAIISNKNIFFGTSEAVGDSIDDDNEKAFVKQQTGGVTYTNTESPRPPELSASDFTPPNTKCVYELPAGTYQFAIASVIYPPWSSEPVANNFKVSIISSLSAPSCDSEATIHVQEFMLRIPKDVNIQVNGDFTLKTVSSFTTTRRAKLGLGYNNDGYMETGDYPAFHTKGGTFSISGELVGEGSVIAEKTTSGGTINLEGRSALSTDANQGVAIYADGDVNITPISSTSLSGGNTDFAAYKNAITAANTGKTAAVTGSSKYRQWLHNWDNNYSGDKDDSAKFIKNQVIGSAYYDATSGNMVITLKDGSTINVKTNSEFLGPLLSQTQFQIDSASPTDMTMGNYVRAKRYETSGYPLARKASDNAVNGLIKNQIETFWDDRTNIEEQLSSNLERLSGSSRFTYKTSAQGNSYCSSCNTYKKYKDAQLLVSFEDYWKYPSIGDKQFKNGSTSVESAYESNFGTYWKLSSKTSAQDDLTPQDAEFTGVIYTKGNLSAIMGDSSTSKYNKFFVEGALISLNGDMDIKYADKVNFLYNPDYLTKFVMATGSSVQTRLVQVFWVMW